MSARIAAGLIAIMLITAGCQSHSRVGVDTSAGTTASAAQTVPDAWLGRWDGVEGTFLNLSRDGSKYTVVIQDLDGPRTFDGVAEGGRVRFVRDGKAEYLVAGDGKASGMKWLGG